MYQIVHSRLPVCAYWTKIAQKSARLFVADYLCADVAGIQEVWEYRVRQVLVSLIHNPAAGRR